MNLALKNHTIRWPLATLAGLVFSLSAFAHDFYDGYGEWHHRHHYEAYGWQRPYYPPPPVYYPVQPRYVPPPPVVVYGPPPVWREPPPVWRPRDHDGWR
jgi:hypothetical protein